MGVIKFPHHQIERYSNSLRAVPAGITQVKRCNYSVYRGKTVMGDAPKELVRIYSYSKDNHFRKINVKRWPLYIAKTGHKWYPIESIPSDFCVVLVKCLDFEWPSLGLP